MLSKRILVISQNAGFSCDTDVYLWRTAGLLKDNGTEVFGAFRHKERDYGKFTEAFTGVFELGELPEGDFDMVAVHSPMDSRFLEKVLEKFGGKAVLFIHDHSFYCPRRSMRPIFGKAQCRNPNSAFSCAFCSMLSCPSSWSRGFFGELSERVLGFGRRLELMKSFANVVVMSKYMKDNLILNAFSQDRISVVPPYVQVPETVPDRPEIGEPVILLGGSVLGKAEYELFFQVLARLANRYVAFVLGTVADLTAMEKLERKLGIERHVKYLGWCNPPYKEYVKSDIAIFPMREPVPTGLSSATVAAWGIPIVAFDAGGIREAVSDGDNAKLVSYGDIAAMATATDRMLESYARRHAMGKKGREIAAKRFSAENYLAAMEKLMGRLG